MTLKEMRLEIDRIDEEMLQLFEERMGIVKLVKSYKKEHQLNVLDTTREQQVLEKNLLKLKDKTLEKAYIKFLQHLMDLSKELQQ